MKIAAVIAIAIQIVSAADLAGRYVLRGMGEAASELLLKSDGSYEFALTYGAADWDSKGKWIERDGIVYLNSDSQEQQPPFRLLHSHASKSGLVRIRIHTPQGGGVPNVEVGLFTNKGKHVGSTDSNGVAAFSTSDMPQSAAFRIRAYHLETELYELNHSHDNFTFVIDEDAVRFLRFTDERVTPKGDMLILHFWGPDQEMQYVRR